MHGPKKGLWSLGEREAGKTLLGERGGERLWSAPWGCAGSSVQGHLSGGLGRIPQEIHQFSRCVLSESWSLMMGQHHAGVGESLVDAAGPDVSLDLAGLDSLLFWAKS